MHLVFVQKPLRDGLQCHLMKKQEMLRFRRHPLRVQWGNRLIHVDELPTPIWRLAKTLAPVLPTGSYKEVAGLGFNDISPCCGPRFGFMRPPPTQQHKLDGPALTGLPRNKRNIELPWRSGPGMHRMLKMSFEYWRMLFVTSRLIILMANLFFDSGQQRRVANKCTSDTRKKAFPC